MTAHLLCGAQQVVTCASASAAGVLTEAAVLLRDDRVAAIGSEQELRDLAPDAYRIDCQDCVITPGLVDSHTHAVFGAWRAHEYELRAHGLSYMEIARQGGGINASVRDVRARSEDELLELSIPRVWDCIKAGTTTLEIKSGYGLRTADELKMLRVVQRLRDHVPIHIVPTFLGAHEFPPKYRHDRSAYVDLVVNEMIPAVAESKLAVFCDVFMEPGVFDAEESRRILEAATSHGLIPKLHADEFANSGAAELAAELKAASADHLGAISPAGIAALSASGTVATLLPTTLFFLGKSTYAPARELLDSGVTVALATDFNPGTSPSPNLPLAMTLACSYMRMDPLEALVAATRGGAQALRLQQGEGTITAGAPADLVVWSAADYREIPYRFGYPAVREVWAGGQRIVNSL